MNAEAHESAASCRASDLAAGKSAIFLWYLPTLALVVGLGWSALRPWLWIPAFLVMGIGCLVNASRCGRFHCYFTGPLFLISAVYVALAAAGLVPLRPGLLLFSVFLLSSLACMAELPFGKYRKAV